MRIQQVKWKRQELLAQTYIAKYSMEHRKAYFSRQGSIPVDGASIHPLLMPMHSANVIPTNSEEKIYLLPSSIDTLLTAMLARKSLTKISISVLQKESSFVYVDNIFDGDTLHSGNALVAGGGLAAIAEGGERRRYHGTIEWVRRGGRMLNFSIPPRAVAENDGVEVGGGGGGGLMVGGRGNKTSGKIGALPTR
jgi:hypothetical protein